MIKAVHQLKTKWQKLFWTFSQSNPQERVSRSNTYTPAKFGGVYVFDRLTGSCDPTKSQCKV